MSLLGFSLGHRLKASLAAIEKSSLASKPSCLPNLDIPALTMLTSGFPFKREFPSQINHTIMHCEDKNHYNKTHVKPCIY
jgi:hypothetical protein